MIDRQATGLPGWALLLELAAIFVIGVSLVLMVLGGLNEVIAGIIIMVAALTCVMVGLFQLTRAKQRERH